MRVLIDTTCTARGPSGTATYVGALIDALREVEDIEVVEASRERRLAPGRRGAGRGPAGMARSAANLAAEAAWLRRGLPAAARRAEADVIHHPLPAWSRRWAGAQVSTLHDLAYERLPDAFDPWWRAIARRSHRRAALRCEAVVSVSETTARDAASRWGVDRATIVVAHHGPAAAPASTGEREHLLYVGDAEPRKNVPLLIEGWVAYAKAEREAGREPLELVLAGAVADAADVQALAAEERSHPEISLVASPSAEELDRLYSRTTALVHPSLHEGFGLTMLEAMARGVPVVAARTAGSTEVCGEAAAYFDPRDPGSLAARLQELTPELLDGLGRAGLERAGAFSWQRSAELHRDAYILALSRHRERTS